MSKAEKKVALKNLLILGLTTPISSLANFLMTIVIARYLLSEGFGIYSTIVSIISVFLVFIEGGRILIARNIAREPGQLKEIFAVTKGMLWILSLITFFGILLVMSFSRDLPGCSIVTFCIAGVAALANYHALGRGIVFIATERMEINAVGSVAHKFIGLLLVFIATFFKQDLNGILAAIAIANFSLWLFYGVIFRRVHGKVPLDLRLDKILDLIKQFAVVGGISIVRRFSWSIDIILLTWISSAAAAGIFNGGYNIIITVNMLPTMIMFAFFPMLSRTGMHGRERLRKMMNKALLYFFLVSGPLVFLVYSYVDEIILFLLGYHYVPSIPVMKMLTFDLLFSIPISMLLYCFIALNLQKIYLSAAMTGFVCNVGFDLLFIPSYGPLGAAMGTLIGDAACLLALLLGNYLIKVDLGVGVERLSPRIEP